MFVGSDVAAFIEHTRDAVELGQDQAVVITADGYAISDFHGNPDVRVPRVSYRLGPERRREGRLRVLHAQGDRRAARRGGRHLVGAFRRRPHRARRAAAVRSGAARGGQGVRGGLRHRLSLRAAGQVRHRALDPAAGGGGAGQRVPLPRPGAGPQHPGGGDLASPGRPPTRWRRCATPRRRRPRCWPSATPTAPRFRGSATRCSTPGPDPRSGWPPPRRFWRRSPPTIWSGWRWRRPAAPNTATRWPASTGSWKPCPSWWRGCWPPSNPSPSWPAASRRPRRCCFWAATSATRWRWRARSSSRSWPTCTPRGSPPVSSNTARSR